MINLEKPEIVSGPQIGASNSFAKVAATNEPLDLGLLDDETQNKFQEIGLRNGRRPNKGQSRIAGNDRRPQKSKGIGGEAGQSDVLKAGPTQFQVQITNVNPSLSCEDIKSYICGKQGNVDVSNVADTSSPGWSTKRFLLTFAYEHMNDVLAKEFWPKNIYFKRWFAPKSKENKTMQ